MKQTLLLLAGALLLEIMPIQAGSMVYNFRIAQLTKQPIFEHPHDRTHSLVLLPFISFFKKYAGPTQTYTGGLASYIFDTQHFYARIDTAGAHIRAQEHHITTYHGSASDDILLSAGYSHRFTKEHTVVTFSALTGIPTHDVDILKHPDFGYGQASIGGQIDGATSFGPIHSAVYGTRYFYFIPRTAYDRTKQAYRFSNGNLYDVLLAYKANWQQHGYEFGYTVRANFGARCMPLCDEILKRINYVRSNFYAVYKYKFIIGRVAHRLLFDVGYSFDHKSKIYGNKYIVTTWASWQVNF